MKIPLGVNIIVLSAIFIFIWGWFSASLILKVPKLSLDINPADFDLNFENIGFKTGDGINIDGWFIYASPPERDSRVGKKSDKTIIVCHGWGANRADVFPSTRFLLKEGYNLLYFDFRNHGKSGGRVSSLGGLESYDLRAAVDFLKKEKQAESKKIGVYGISMGAAVSIITASQDRRIEAVVADSPFSSFNYIVVRYAKLFYKIPKYPLMPVTFLFTRLRLGFNPEKTSAVYSISKISPRPVFFIHGEEDMRIPVSEGKKLYELAGEPKEFWSVPGADHMEASSINSIEYRKKVGGFFKKYLK
ncbi:MAG: alpha/beta fold hydrolase [Elusimicrobia bacterium]|nr:alpha/beta fold hydrolase [Elusimicrobiota bacterium]